MMAKNSFGFFPLRRFHTLLTLYNNLITGHKDLLAVRRLCILKDGGALLGSTSGDRLQTLKAFGPWGGQLDCAISGYSN